jgi:hypothetical protein
MFMNCHKCEGKGYIKKNFREKKRHMICLNCWETHNSIFRGKIWIEDTRNPITPPNSPRF